MKLEPKQRVRVKSLNDTGTIIYARMAGPNYNAVEAYSVYLDSKKDNLKYSGTIVPAHEVEKE